METEIPSQGRGEEHSTKERPQQDAISRRLDKPSGRRTLPASAAEEAEAASAARSRRESMGASDVREQRRAFNILALEI